MRQTKVERLTLHKIHKCSILNASTALTQTVTNTITQQETRRVPTYGVYHYRIPLDGIPFYHDFMRIILAASLLADNTSTF